MTAWRRRGASLRGDPQSQDLSFTVDGDADGGLDGTVRDGPLADRILTTRASTDTTGWIRRRSRFCDLSAITRSAIFEIVSLETSAVGVARWPTRVTDTRPCLHHSPGRKSSSRSLANSTVSA